MLDNRHSGFWTNYVHGTTPTRLSIDRGHRGRHTHNTAAEARHTVSTQIGSGITRSIRARCDTLEIGFATLANAAWARLLGSYAGETDLLFLAASRKQGHSAAEVSPLRTCVKPARIIQDWLAELEKDRRRAEHHPAGTLADASTWSLFGTAIYVDLTVSRAAATFRDTAPQMLAPFVLDVHVGTEVLLTFSYPEGHLDTVLARELIEQLRQLLIGMGSRPDRAVWEFATIQGSFAQRALRDWNSTLAPFDRTMTMHGLFERQARRTPDRVAIVAGDGSMTYAELESRSNRLANHLIIAGVASGNRIGLCTEKSTATVVAMLAVMKAGAAYVPIDPTYPLSRIAYMVEDARLSALLTWGQGTSRTDGITIPRVALDHEWDQIARHPDTAPERVVPPDAFAYVIYTSGSTGHPKGVMLNHSGRVNNILDYCQRLGFGVDDAVLCVSSLSFDISVCNVFTMLCVGGRVVFPVPEAEKDPDHWLDLVADEGVTVWHSAPTLFDVLLDTASDRPYRNDTLRVALLGGDWVPLSQPGRARAAFPSLRFVTAGGATELSIDSTVYEVAEVSSDWLSIPYGRPLTNQTALILDANMEIAPIGVPGELLLGGVGMAAGYLDRPALTAEKFVPHPWPSNPGERLYRTGDLARYGHDGLIELLGRIDFQVKIRGVRIELGEIESALRTHPMVANCLTGAPATARGERRLCAYVVPIDSAVQINPVAMRDWLRERLPESLVPEAFVTLDALPLTPNGKVDRRNLPAVAEAAEAGAPHEPPREGIEQTVAELWRAILRLPEVSRTEHFFASGGHSIHAVRLISRLRRDAGIEVPLSTLFAAPVLHLFAEAIERFRRKGGVIVPAITPVPRGETIPLSFAQRRLWFMAQLGGASSAYHMPLAIHLRGRLDVAALRRSLDALFERHESLRTVFHAGDGRPYATLLAVAHGFPCIEVDLNGCGDASSELLRQVRDEAVAPFNLTIGPPVRARLLRLSDGEHALLITQHHIVSDGWSTGVLLKDLSTIYASQIGNGVATVPALSVQYSDYAAWERQWLHDEHVAKQADYWRTVLASVPTFLPLPTDRLRPETQSYRGAQVPIRFDEGLTQQLKALSLSCDATLFMVLMAAWAVILGRLSGRDDLVIGTPIANRGRQEIEPLIGFFVSTLPMRVDLRGAPSCAELIGRVRKGALEAHANQDLPFERIVEIVNPPRRADCSPLFQVAFSWQNNDEATLELPAIDATPIAVPIEFAKFDLELSLKEHSETIGGALDYATDLFDAATAERFVARFEQVLRQFAQNPSLSVDAVDIGLGTALPAVVSTEHGGSPIPLSWHQERLWFIDTFETGYLYPANPTYHNIPLLLTLDGNVNEACLHGALNDVVARHEILRTRIHSDETSARQMISLEPRIPLDVRHVVPADALEAAIRTSREPFDLRSDTPLVRATLLHTGTDRALLCIVVHHLIADRWSMRQIAVEWLTAYSARVRGLVPASFEQQVHFADYVTWQQHLPQEIDETLLAYWKLQLRGTLQPMELPLNRARMGVHVFEEGRHAFHLSSTLVESLYATATRLGVTPFAVFFAGFNMLLGRYANSEELVVGTSARCRDVAGSAQILGPLANLIVQRNAVDDDFDLASFIRRVHLTERQGYRHKEMQFDRLTTALNPDKDMSRTALFDVLFDFDDEDPVAYDDGVLSVRVVETNLGFGKYDLHLHVHADTDGFAGKLVYNKLFFDTWFVEQMMDHYVTVLTAVAQDTSQLICDLQLMNETEIERQVTAWNDTASDYDREGTIHALFEAQAERTPNRAAVSFEGTTLSYRELNERANRVAYAIGARKLPFEPLIPMLIERSVDMIAGMLGVLKAGGAYVPIDPTTPDERIRFILDDCAASLLIVSSAHTDFARAYDADVLVLDEATAATSGNAVTNPRHASSPEQLAYVIYTSGSTGHPKGTLLEHRHVVRLMRNATHPFAFGEDDVWSMFHSYTFDFSVWEMYGALLYGGRIAIVPDGGRKDPSIFLRFVTDERVTVLNQTPSAFYGFSAAAVAADGATLPHLRYAIFGGETLDPAALAAFHSTFGQVALVNMYGITETCVHVTFKRIEAEDITANLSNIGRPIPTTMAYVLDDRQRLLPIGVLGEICVGGLGVARGYLNRPELNTQRFIENPYDPGGRLYRSGDKGKLLPNGEILHLGRIDDQIKLRGFRIEIGEIQNVLVGHPSVREATVIAREDVPGDKRLVAYVVPTVDDSVDPTELTGVLRTHLSACLPEYMVPAAFVRLDAFPLTPNGKLDRKALPAPDGDAFARRAYEPPQGEIEIALASIWEELLGLGNISRHDNFFALGGHSLMAVQLLNRLPQTLGVTLPVVALFAHPCLADFALAIADTADRSGPLALPPIAIISRDGSLPLSFAQQRLWFLAQLDGVSATYHMPMALRLHGPLDTLALRRSLDALWSRHEALRSVFLVNDGQPHVALLPPETGLPLIEHDLRHVTNAAEQVERLCTEEAHALFDLTQGPLIRARLLRLAEHEHIFLFTQHHIVSDGWSMGVMINELSALYRAFSQGHADPLPPLAIQYPDYAAWQRQWLAGERLAAQVDYWRQTLADAPVLLDLPTDRPRPPQQTFAGDALAVHIDTDLTQGLKRLSQQHGTTLFMTLMAAWAAVLARLSGQDDLVIGTPTANRSRREIEPLIGFFVNTLALRIDLSGEPSVAELLARVRQTALDAQDHQDLPFEQVVEIVQPPRRLDHTPLFQVMFAWQNNEAGVFELPSITVTPETLSLDTAKFDLELHLHEKDDCIFGVLSYATALFDAATIERYRDYLPTMLRAMVANAEQSVARIDLLAPEERTLLLETWNQTQAPYPQDLCIHQLFEQQAQHSPDAKAVTFAEQSLTYAQLNMRANQLAHHLLGQGVHPDDRIAICVERSPAMVVGLLAILKAGGAYVPLDPAYPSERLTQILHDAAPVLLLADTAGHTALGVEAVTHLSVLDLDALQPLWHHLPSIDPQPQTLGLTAEHLAYVIYTSGSTGTPKGVAMPHSPLVNLTHWQIAQDRNNEKRARRTLQFAALGFDVAFQEIFSTLCAGAELELIDSETRLDFIKLIPHLCKRHIQRLHLPYIALHNLADTVAGQGGHNIELSGCEIQEIITAGEQLRITPQIAAFFERLPTCRLHNHYGPTESHVATTFTSSDAIKLWPELPSIGRPIANARIYLLDAHRQPVPLGASGELYIGGASVARGYLNRPELTAERFLTDPFNPTPGTRMYRTGDLARYLPDGNLVFLGRNDHQVKIRGFRIEPGEIEARLTEQPAIREAIVLAREDVPGDKRLVAYVVPAPDDATEPGELVAALRLHLSARLPEYMVPAAFVRLDALPLTPNGKLDRRALPAPEGDAFARQAYEPPQGEIEIALACIWEELLGIEQVSRHDNFFALGGHSLLAVRLLSQIQGKFDVPIALSVLFNNPELALFAKQVLVSSIMRQFDHDKLRDLVDAMTKLRGDRG